MKIRASQKNQKGLAVLVVVAIIGLLTALSMANAKALYHLSQELQMIEKRQQRKYTLPLTTTNTNKPAGKLSGNER